MNRTKCGTIRSMKLYYVISYILQHVLILYTAACTKWLWVLIFHAMIYSKW